MEQETGQTDVRALIERGNELLKDERIPEAAAEFARVAQVAPQDPGGHLGLAQTNLALGQYQIASMAVQQVQQLAPDSADAALAEAIGDVIDRRYEAGLDATDREIALDPTRAYSHALRAYIFRRLGRNYDAALSEARAARLSGKRDWDKLFPPADRAPLPFVPMPTPVAPSVAGAQAYAAPRPWDQRSQVERQMTRIRFLTRGLPIATFSLIIANVIIFAISQIPALLNPIYGFGIVDDRAILNNPLESYRFFTAMFLHQPLIQSALPLHLLLNMLSLYFIGVITERVFGTGRFLLIYFLSGIVGGLTQFGVDVFTNHLSGGLGASGAIFGVFGALGAFFLLRRRALGPAGNALIGQWFFWLLINLVFSFGGFSVGGAQIAGFDHLGGLAAGLILGALLLPRSR
jgi:membrane associated rhomboid family serine protease